MFVIQYPEMHSSFSVHSPPMSCFGTHLVGPFGLLKLQNALQGIVGDPQQSELKGIVSLQPGYEHCFDIPVKAKYSHRLWYTFPVDTDLFI